MANEDNFGMMGNNNNNGYTPGGFDEVDHNRGGGLGVGGNKNCNDYANIVGELIIYIFNECLFNVPQQGDSGAKCKAVMSCQWAYGLIQCIADTYPNALPIIQSLILKDPIWYHVNHEDLNKVSWSYHPSDLERFPVKYCGLKNQGATCYMNSLMQQLFIVDGFRHALLEARVLDPSRSAAIIRGGGMEMEQKNDMHDFDAMMENNDATEVDEDIVKA